jgi:hypothetical protein
VLLTRDDLGGPSALTLRTAGGPSDLDGGHDLPGGTPTSTTSEFATWKPGGLIPTSTPCGVGFRSEPAPQLRDVVTFEIA